MGFKMNISYSLKNITVYTNELPGIKKYYNNENLKNIWTV